MKEILNTILLPLKLVVPQPIIKKIPGLTTNEDIRVNKVLQHISSSMTVLDIGCGNNVLIRKHRARGGSGIGVDIFPWEGVDLLIENSAKLPLSDNCFDCVTFVASLNHISRRKETLWEVQRVLRNGGKVILTYLTPKISKTWHKICFWDKDQRERGMEVGEVYGFTHEELRTLLKSVKFKIVEKKTFSWGINHLCICEKYD